MQLLHLIALVSFRFSFREYLYGANLLCVFFSLFCFEKAFYAYPSVCSNITLNFGLIMCVCGDVIGSYDDTLDICVLRFFRVRLVKLVPIAHGSSVEQAYGVQEIPREPYVYPLDEVVRTIRILPLKEENISVYPRTYIRNIRIREKNLTVVDHPFPQPYMQNTGCESNQFSGSCKKLGTSTLSKKTQKNLLKKITRTQKVSATKKASVRYTDLCFRSFDDGPKIIEQIIISPPKSVSEEVPNVENFNGSVEEVEVVQQLDSESIVDIQNSDNENLSAIHNYLESSDDLVLYDPEEDLLSSLDQISPIDYGPLVPPVEANDFVLDAAHDAAVLDALQYDPMLSSTAANDDVDLSAYADFDEAVFNDLIESMNDFQ